MILEICELCQGLFWESCLEKIVWNKKIIERFLYFMKLIHILKNQVSLFWADLKLLEQFWIMLKRLETILNILHKFWTFCINFEHLKLF